MWKDKITRRETRSIWLLVGKIVLVISSLLRNKSYVTPLLIIILEDNIITSLNIMINCFTFNLLFSIGIFKIIIIFITHYNTQLRALSWMIIFEKKLIYVLTYFVNSRWFSKLSCFFRTTSKMSEEKICPSKWFCATWIYSGLLKNTKTGIIM